MRRELQAYLLVALLSLGTWASSAIASATYTFSGSITASEASGTAPTDMINVGDLVTGTLFYDSSAFSGTIFCDSSGCSSGYGNAAQAYYEPLASVQFVVGSVTWTNTFGTSNLGLGSGIDAVNSSSGQLTGIGVPPNGFDDGAGRLIIPGVVSWIPPSSYPVSNIALPDKLDLANFTGGTFTWSTYFPNLYGTEVLRFAGAIDHLEEVPEPGTLALLGLGLAGLGFTRRRKTNLAER